MSHNPKEFPAVANKLSAPTKKSVFEKQKAEAEAKRLKEQAETAAVYADFVKSFDDEDDAEGHYQHSRGGPLQQAGPGGFGKRHFVGTPRTGGKPGLVGARVSGPGSLGPASSSASRKRTYEGGDVQSSRPGLLGFDSPTPPADVKRNFQEFDEEDTKKINSRDAERANAKPTLHLSNLPPFIASSVVKQLLPSNLRVDSIKILPQNKGSSADRRSGSALVTLAQDTPAGDIDGAVNLLQNRYLGWGYNLNLSRHLSSAAISSGMATSGLSGQGSLPFGAKQTPRGPTASLSRAPPPPGMDRAFAPPASYGNGAGISGRPGGSLLVEVKPPSDLRQLKLIHRTVENVITHGPQFEALLMSRYSVQKDERWAWLWNARSQGGVWYRWRLWDVITGASKKMKGSFASAGDNGQVLFSGGATWQPQERALPFEYVTQISDFVSDSEYNSSSEDDSGDEGRQRLSRLQGSGFAQDNMALGEADVPNYLNPLHKAKLVHLLARLPNATAKLRRGDIARITAFAIRYASEGADEVVQLITSNVHTPFSLTNANPERQTGTGEDENVAQDDLERERDSSDVPSLKLIGLYVISDILSSSSTSGVRHAWRYRQLFETSLHAQNTFVHLGRLEKDLQWGRLRAEKFKRSVNSLLSLWEGWCVFPVEAQEEFVKSFNEPPLTEEEQQEETRKAQEEENKKKAAKKWKTVEQSRNPVDTSEHATPNEAMDVDEGFDGESMMEADEDVDGEPMEDEDLDGVPMADSDDDVDEAPTNAGSNEPEADGGPVYTPEDGKVDQNPEVKQPRSRRPRAEDMFADSDGE